MINSHLLYRLSYRGTTARMLLIKKEKSTLQRDIYVVEIRVSSDGVVGGALAAMAVSPQQIAAEAECLPVVPRPAVPGYWCGSPAPGRSFGFCGALSNDSRLKPLLQRLLAHIKTPAYGPAFLFITRAYSTAWIARVTLSRLPLFSAATQMRPVPTA